MKGKGIRAERETVICFNEEDASASIWTASETIYRRLMKLGYCPTEDNGRSARFEVPKRDTRLPRPKRVLTEKQKTASLRGLKSARDTRFCSGTPSGERV